MPLPGGLSDKVGGRPFYQWVGLGAVAVAVLMYFRRKSSGSSAAGPITLQPAPTGTPMVDFGGGGGGGTNNPPPVSGGGGGITNPPPSGGGIPTQPITAVADTISPSLFQSLAQQFPHYNDPGLAALYPQQGANFPFSQSSQADCGSGQTFVSASEGCLNNDAYQRMFGSGHASTGIPGIGTPVLNNSQQGAQPVPVSNVGQGHF